MDQVKFHLGQTVHLVVNEEFVGMVTGIVFRLYGVGYYITWNNCEEKTHYEFELTDEKNYVPEST